MASKTKASFNFSAFADDSDDESVCSCPHTPEVDSLEYKILRSRFWVWPEDESAAEAWPCRCSDPAFAVEGTAETSFWECPHGKWEFISSWDSLPPLAEDHPLSQCRSTSCKAHGLCQGAILEMELCSQVGIGWGDLVWKWEQEALAALTPQERLALAVRKEAEEKARQKAMAEAEIRKAAQIQQIHKKAMQRVYDRRTGEPVACKWAEHPAENGWEAGCGKHREGCCPYFHPDEPEWAIIKGRAPLPPGAGGAGARNFSALRSAPSSRPPSGGSFSRPGSGGGMRGPRGAGGGGHW